MSGTEGLGPTAAAGLGVFAKEPRRGRVKTRLSPPLTPAEATAFYTTVLEETVHRLAAGPLPVTLFVDGDPAWFAARFPQLPLRPQGDGDLGTRMERALGYLLDQGAPGILVGSDTPDLPTALLTEAAGALRTNDAVAAPALDGGYVLIGLRRPLPALFRDMPWSTDRVLAASRARARKLGVAWKELNGWEDLDDWEAVQRLLRRSPGSASARHVRRRLDRLLGGPCAG